MIILLCVDCCCHCCFGFRTRRDDISDIETEAGTTTRRAQNQGENDVDQHRDKGEGRNIRRRAIFCSALLLGLIEKRLIPPPSSSSTLKEISKTMTMMRRILLIINDGGKLRIIPFNVLPGGGASTMALTTKTPMDVFNHFRFCQGQGNRK